MSVPLLSYRQHPGCGVLLICRGCQQQRGFDLEAVIARLTARGVAVESVGIQDVSDYVAQPCPRCGGRRFDTRPAWSRSNNEPGRPPYGGF